MFQNRIFRITETPVLLGLLFVFIAWSAKHIVDRVTGTPLIEYHMEWISNNEYQKWTERRQTYVLDCKSRQPITENNLHYLHVTLRNLSDKLYFENVEFGFGVYPNSKSTIRGSQLASKSPAIKQDNVESCSHSFMRLNKINFHPQWEYELVMALEGSKEPYIVLQKSKVPLILERRNFKTRIVNHELMIFIVLLALNFIVLLVYLVAIAKTPEITKEEK